MKNSINLGLKKIKVVVDTGNGTGAVIIKKVLDLFDIEYTLLYGDSNGEFPNHQPDPSVYKNQADLEKKVKELNYDFGFSVDGDADRVGIVDEFGKIIPTDHLMILIYRNLIDKLKNRKAIYDVKCSKTLIDELDKLGLKSTMYRTGNSYMNRVINAEDYDFGGEFSGHIWFRDRFPGFDDGIYAGLRVLEILSKTDKTVSELLAGTNYYYSTEEIKLKVTEETKFKIVEQVKNYVISKNYNFSDIDGVRVIYEDGFALIRSSNTSPNLTVRFEASTEEILKERQSEFIDIIDYIKNRI
jgi:phosphomannomutase/phosphoglucomutase